MTHPDILCAEATGYPRHFQAAAIDREEEIERIVVEIDGMDPGSFEYEHRPAFFAAIMAGRKSYAYFQSRFDYAERIWRARQ